MDYTDIYSSPLGHITLASRGDHLIGLWFEGQKHFGSALTPGCRQGRPPVLAAARAWLDRYFQGEDPGPPPPLAPQGTPFQRTVWGLLLQIPRGQVTTYVRLAAQLAAPPGSAAPSPRAVGSAVGRNPISILIPCHRVVGADGSLRGYAGGLERKEALLSLEHADQKRFCF